MSAPAPGRSGAENVSTGSIVLESGARLLSPVASVFAALTEAGSLTRWFCDRAESEPRAGGRLVLGWNGAGAGAESFAGHWTAFEPFRACAYVGGHSGYPDGVAGLVEFALEPHRSGKGLAGAASGGTRLSVRHTFPPRPEYETIATKYRFAWPRALARLEALLALHSRPEMRP